LANTVNALFFKATTKTRQFKTLQNMKKLCQPNNLIRQLNPSYQSVKAMYRKLPTPIRNCCALILAMGACLSAQLNKNHLSNFENRYVIVSFPWLLLPNFADHFAKSTTYHGKIIQILRLTVASHSTVNN